MHKTVTQETIDYCLANRIFFHHANVELGLKVGDRLVFEDDAEVEPYIGFYANKTLCSMGAFSYTNANLSSQMRVGRYCSIAWGLRVQGMRHPYEYISSSNFTYSRGAPTARFLIADEKKAYNNYKPVITKPAPLIAHDVWIGQDVALNNGVSIAIGAVVASQSVVTKDVGPYEIVGGNPAKLIKKRFDDDTIAMLLESEWWHYKFTDFADLPIDKPGEFAREFLNMKRDLTRFRPEKIRLASIP
jgi:virginiamycin A acetyltransferase